MRLMSLYSHLLYVLDFFNIADKLKNRRAGFYEGGPQSGL